MPSKSRKSNKQDNEKITATKSTLVKEVVVTEIAKTDAVKRTTNKVSVNAIEILDVKPVVENITKLAIDNPVPGKKGDINNEFFN